MIRILVRQLCARRVHRTLARANGLSDAEARWLWRLARRECPARPELVFVRPGLMQGHAGADAVTAAAVRDKLFAD